MGFSRTVLDLKNRDGRKIIVLALASKNLTLALALAPKTTGLGLPRNDLYCVGWDVKPYSLTHSLGLGNAGLEPILVSRTVLFCPRTIAVDVVHTPYALDDWLQETSFHSLIVLQRSPSG